MRRYLFSLVWLGVVIACQPSSSQLTESHRIAIEDSVRQFLTEYSDKVNGGDLLDIIPYYANEPGFHWLENGTVSYPSYDSVVTVLEMLAPTVAEIRVKFEEPRVVALAPGVALLTTSFQEFFADTSGTEFEFGGALSIVTVHRDDGWKFLSGHASAPVQSGR